LAYRLPNAQATGFARPWGAGCAYDGRAAGGAASPSSRAGDHDQQTPGGGGPTSRNHRSQAPDRVNRVLRMRLRQCLAGKPSRRLRITLGREQKVDRLAAAVDGSAGHSVLLQLSDAALGGYTPWDGQTPTNGPGIAGSVLERTAVHRLGDPVGGPVVSHVPNQLPWSPELMLLDRGVKVDHTSIFPNLDVSISKSKPLDRIRLCRYNFR
jgi:hypothetical protein